VKRCDEEVGYFSVTKTAVATCGPGIEFGAAKKITASDTRGSIV